MSEYLTYTLWRQREERMRHELEQQRVVQERLNEQEQHTLEQQELLEQEQHELEVAQTEHEYVLVDE